MTASTLSGLGRPCTWAAVLGLLMPALGLYAREMSRKEVAAAVETWVRKVPAQARPDAVIEKLDAQRIHGKTVAYIAHLVGGGYCICGTDDELLPVYLYSPGGRLDPADPDLPFFIQSIPKHKQRIEAVRKEKSPKSSEYAAKLIRRAADWQRLVRGEAPLPRAGVQNDPVTPSVIALPANSYWSQRSPFNQACPALPPGSSNHCAVGCVGTATSQIMYYWKWPITGVGASSVPFNYRYSADWIAEPLATDPEIPADWAPYDVLKWESTNGGELKMKGYWDWSMIDSAQRIEAGPAYYAALNDLWARMTWFSEDIPANPGATTYRWDLMRDSYAGVPADDPAVVAVMGLCRDVAVIEYMQFGTWGSSASTSIVTFALPTCFRYDDDAVWSVRNATTMIDEIRWLRPIQMSGEDEYGAGHSWMTCGYDATSEPVTFRVNRGHGAGSGEWLAVDEYWAYDQEHITRIAPAGVVRFVGSTVTGDGSPGSPFQNISEAVSAVADGTTLIFKAGTTNTFSTTSLTIDRPMTLKGYQVSIQRQ